MRLTKKIMTASALALTLFSTNLFSDGRASPFDSTYNIVHAEDDAISINSSADKKKDIDDTVRDSMSGMTKISSGQSISDSEKTSLDKIVRDPKKYITSDRSAEYMNALESLMKNKPNELAKALGVDPATAFTGLQSELANWKNTSSSSANKDTGASLAGSEIDSKYLNDLKSKETYSTLYASIVYSLSKGESADSTSISLAQMMRYPVVSKDGAKVEGAQYGALASPGFGDESQEEGKKLATYVKTLHEYNYLVTKDKTGFSGFWDWLTGGVVSVARAFLLQTAWLGAALYDFSMAAINWFIDGFTKFNIIEISGLGSAIRGTDSFLNRMMKSMFETIGITGAFVRTAQYLFYIIIIASFLLAVISQLRKSKSRQAVTTLQRNGIKIFTIIMTIPLMSMMYTTTAAIFDNVKLAASDSQQIANNYVINVTDWAGTMNLSLSPISTNSIAATGEVDKTFEPTTANIGKINAAVNALKSATASDADKNAQAGKSARDQVQALIGDKESTVQDYFNFIASRKTSGSGLAAEYLPKVSSSTTQGATKTYLLVSRDKKDDVKDVVKKLLGISDENANGAESSESAQPSYTYKVADTKDVTIGLDSKYDLLPVVWNNPTSYLYGAIQAGNLTDSTLNHANYHLSGYTNMLNDPSTGETASDDDLSKALASNAINLALINKYGGVSYAGQMKTLSSQSVAFLLQSKLSNDTLVYKGYNTAANTSGAAKNTGAYGITYVENVVPSTSLADYMSKIAGLNSVWLSAGVVAFFVFIALMKAPILGSAIQHFKGFYGGLFKGNIISLFEAILYYLALASSFLFAYLSTSIGLFITSSILSSSFLSYLTFLPVIGPILISLLIALLMTWPIMKLRLGVSNKNRKVGLAMLLVSVPYILVESMDEYLDRFNYALYGKSKRQSFGAKVNRQVEVINQGDMAKKGLKKVVDVGVGVARTIAGDPTGAMQAVGALSGEQDDPNAINDTKQSRRSVLGKAATLAAGAVLGKGAGKVVEDVVDTADTLKRERSLKDVVKDDDREADPSLERVSALRTSSIENQKDDTLQIDSSSDDASRLDEIADNTARLLNKEQQVEIIDKDEHLEEKETQPIQNIEQTLEERESQEKDAPIIQENRDKDISIVQETREKDAPIIQENRDKDTSIVQETREKDAPLKEVRSYHKMTESSKEIVSDQLGNLKDGSKAVYDKGKTTIDAVVDSPLGRTVADAINSAVTGKPIEQIRLEKSHERVERDIQKETHRETVRNERQIHKQTREKRVEANYIQNKQNFNSDALSKGLAQIQTAVQDAGRNKVIHTTAKVVQQAAKPFTMGIDNIVFDGEKVLSNALKGIKPSEVEQSRSSNRRSIDSYSDRSERYESRRRDNEKMIDAIDEMTNELRRNRK